MQGRNKKPSRHRGGFHMYRNWSLLKFIIVTELYKSTRKFSFWINSICCWFSNYRFHPAILFYISMHLICFVYYSNFAFLSLFVCFNSRIPWTHNNVEIITHAAHLSWTRIQQLSESMELLDGAYCKQAPLQRYHF